MDIICPCGYSDKIKAGCITLEYLDVTVYDGICDHCDLCKIEQCQFYDITREGTRRFKKAMLECEASVEKQLDEEEKSKRYQGTQKIGLRIIKGKV